MPIVAHHALVAGHVQGVAFRHWTKLRARELGLAGWVRNLADGRVEVWAEGEAEPVAALIDWLRHGPPMARVEDVAVQAVEPAGHPRFAVRLGDAE